MLELNIVSGFHRCKRQARKIITRPFLLSSLPAFLPSYFLETSPELDHSETRQYPTVECSHRNNTGFYRLTRPPSYQNNHDSSHQSIPAGFIVNMQQASSSDNAATVLPPPPPAYKDHYRDTLLHPPLANPETSNWMYYLSIYLFIHPYNTYYFYYIYHVIVHHCIKFLHLSDRKRWPPGTVIILLQLGPAINSEGKESVRSLK